MIKDFNIKFISTLVISLLVCSNVYAKKIKNGSGILNLSEKDVEIFHIYLTQKLQRGSFSPVFNGQELPGFHLGGSEPVYGDYFLIKYENQINIWAWGSSINQNPGNVLKVMFSSNPSDYKIFAKKNKIQWKGKKKKLPRDITIEELKKLLRELGFIN